MACDTDTQAELLYDFVNHILQQNRIPLLGLGARNSVKGISEEVRLKPVCSATAISEDYYQLDFFGRSDQDLHCFHLYGKSILIL